MRLLIGYDGSDCADIAIDDLQRAGLPDSCHATVLSVADIWPGLAPGEVPDWISVDALAGSLESARLVAEKARHDAELAADRGADRVRGLFPSWKVERACEAGSPAQCLIDQAQRLGTQLIVIGSHGRGALRRMLFGSVSQNVMHHAHCDVRVARPQEQRPAGPLRVMIGIDASPGSAAAVRAVAGRKWPVATEVHLVTAMDVRLATVLPMPGEPMGFWEESADAIVDQRQWVARVQNAAAAKLRDAGLLVQTAIQEGDPKHVLMDEARSRHADCLFLGAKGMSRIERFLLGSVSASIISGAHCTVEIVRLG